MKRALFVLLGVVLSGAFYLWASGNRHVASFFYESAYYLSFPVMIMTIMTIPRIYKVLKKDAVPSKPTDVIGYLVIAALSFIIIYFLLEI